MKERPRSETRVVIAASMVVAMLLLSAAAASLWVLEERYGIALVTEEGGRPCLQFKQVVERSCPCP